jgi:hypothetical protein
VEHARGVRACGVALVLLRWRQRDGGSAIAAGGAATNVTAARAEDLRNTASNPLSPREVRLTWKEPSGPASYATSTRPRARIASSRSGVRISPSRSRSVSSEVDGMESFLTLP